MCEIARFGKDKGEHVVTPNPKFNNLSGYKTHALVNVGTNNFRGPVYQTAMAPGQVMMVLLEL